MKYLLIFVTLNNYNRKLYSVYEFTIEEKIKRIKVTIRECLRHKQFIDKKGVLAIQSKSSFL